MIEPPSYDAVLRDVPLALLPVRLETRFGERVDVATGNEVSVPVLRVRVYPDDISVDDHEPGMTQVEIDAGRTFWTAHETIIADEPETVRAERRIQVWQVFLAAVGAARIGYVARQTRDPAGQPLRRVDARSTARAQLLPDAWVVTGWVDGRRAFRAVSQPVRSPLFVGPAPVSGPTTSRGMVPGRDTEAPASIPLDPDQPFLFDEGSRWLADFDEAVTAGMALTVDLQTPAQAAAGEPVAARDHGIERLLVFGVRVPDDARTVTTEADALRELLVSQDAKFGAAFLAPGTPTNNVGDRSSGWTSRPDPVELYRRVVTPAALGPVGAALRGDAPAGVIAATAFGLEGDAFASFANAAADDLRLPRLMNAAMFPVTWGELIGQLLVPSEFDDTKDHPLVDLLARAFDYTHDHVIDYVRGGGSLPVWQIGRQPYGVLPVTDLGRWRAQPGERDGPMTARLVTLLGRLRSFWNVAAAFAPTLAPGGAVDASGHALAEVLGLGPTPHPGGYWVRPVAGELSSRVYSSTNAGFAIPIDQGDDASRLAESTIARLGTNAQLSIYRNLIASVPDVIGRARLVGMSLKDRAPLRIPVAETRDGVGPATYLRSLGDASIDANLRLVTAAAPPIDLLYQMGHRSLLVANEQAGYAAMRALDDHQNVRRASMASAFSAEAVSLQVTDQPTIPTLMRSSIGAFAASAVGAADEPVEALAIDPELASISIASAVSDNRFIGLLRDRLNLALTPQTELFVNTAAALRALGEATQPDGKPLSDEIYSRLLGETLAVASNRLDAWVTSVATRRLEDLRTARREGIQLGSYGWLLDLRPSNRPTFAAANGGGPDGGPGLLGWDEARVPAGPVLAPERQVGYVHAPSLAQARTAAIIRAGELAHGDEQSTIARIDLTSARVRTGDWILNAVHNGQPLGAVLGYRLERLLHERSSVDGTINLHRFVDDLRARYPQRGRATTPGTEEEVAPREVVDGLLAWQAWTTSPAAVLAGLPLTADERTTFDGVMAVLGDAVDAVADLIVAEGIHQIAAGDHAKAGATFSAVAGGGVPPAEFDVARSPRSGVAITHRVVLPLDADDDLGVAGWSPDQPRALVAPELERWVERRLGPPTGWTIDLVGDDKKTARRTLADAEPLCALDVLAELPPDGGDRSALVERLARGTDLENARIDLSAAATGWSRLAAYAGTLGDLLAAGRPLTETDLADPAPVVDPRGTRLPPPVAIADGAYVALRDRLFGPGGVVSRLGDAVERIEGILPRPDAPPDPAVAPPPIDAVALRASLGVLAGIGIPGSIVATTADAAAVVKAAHAAVAAARRLLDDVNRRRDAFESTAPGTGDPRDVAVRLDGLRTLVQALLGPVVVVSPKLAGVDPAAALLPDQPAQTALEDWLDEHSRARTGLATLADVRMFGSAIERPPIALSVMQRPHDAADGWLGSTMAKIAPSPKAPPRWRTPDGPRVHLLLVGPTGGPPALGRGLVLDEFIELIPAATQTTGLAVHYDAPDARAPQSILLAVHPDPAGNVPWDWELVESMVADTLEMARLRTVELDQLAVTAIDEYLPATYVREGLDLPSLSKLLTDFIAADGAWLPAARRANLTVKGPG